MKKIITKFGIVGLTVFPLMAFAATENLRDLVYLAIQYFDVAIALIISLGVLLFIWNVYRYFIASSDNPESKKEAGLYVMWSVIGFFVILSVWGLVNILVKTFNFKDNRPPSFFGIFSRTQTSVPNTFGNPNTGGTNNGINTGGTNK